MVFAPIPGRTQGSPLRWEDLQAKLRDLTDAELSPEEAATSQAAWQDFLGGKTKPLNQVIKEQLHDRED